jgi:SAM-dependent methyltransferase
MHGTVLTREQITPPLAINHNATSLEEAEYRATFAEHETKVIFPWLVSYRNRTGCYDAIKLLDIGCGFGPMAFAFHCFTVEWRDAAYLGIDIRRDAIEWLRQAYAPVPNIQFRHHAADMSVDYSGSMASQFADGRTAIVSTGDEARYVLEPGFYNVQWTSSVFTHLTPQACDAAMEAIAAALTPDGLAINTWLVIDDASLRALAARITDRELPFDFGDFLTYRRDNPLVCTAYKAGFVKRCHERAGLELIDFLPGSWRGDADNKVSYMDITVARRAPR